MKHLYEYEDEEIKSMITDLEGVGQGPLKGWLISCVFKGFHNAADGTAYISIGAETIREAMSLFATFYGEVYDVETKDLREMLEATHEDDFVQLAYNLLRVTPELDEHEVLQFLSIWDGLNPISKKSFIEQRGTNNIMYTLDEIKKEFSNVESVLRANKSGNV